MGTKVRCVKCFPLTQELIPKNYYKLGTKRAEKLGLDNLGITGYICHDCVIKYSNESKNESNESKKESEILKKHIKILQKELELNSYNDFAKTPIGSGLTQTRWIKGCGCVKCKQPDRFMKKWESHAHYRAGIITTNKFFLCNNCKNDINTDKPLEGCYNLFILQNWNKIKNEILTHEVE